MCDIIWCKDCDTVNYLDPYYFWNWEGKIKCAGCENVYYIYMIQGHMYKGPDKKPGEKPDILPVYADKPNDGYEEILPGTPGKTRPYNCLPRHIYLGRADMVKFSARGRPVRGWRPQPPSTGVAGSCSYTWDIQKLSPEVWQEYQEKIKKGEVSEW
ncbi:MAG: hypothetical protein ACUVSA_00150 [Desulfosoma sp.]|uniref:hypothetical protein n=1 Tax=Desulfosoma sp. TaxID=2603217 RepID=UPI004048F4AC